MARLSPRCLQEISTGCAGEPDYSNSTGVLRFDRFFDVSTGDEREILRSLRSEAMIQGNVMELAGDLETSGGLGHQELSNCFIPSSHLSESQLSIRNSPLLKDVRGSHLSSVRIRNIQYIAGNVKAPSRRKCTRNFTTKHSLYCDNHISQTFPSPLPTLNTRCSPV